MARLADLTANYRRRLETVPRMACAELSNRVIAGTPVDTGALRRSWTPSLGAVIGLDAGGDITATANALQPGGTFSLATAKPYARRIEYEGWSMQAPAGMVGVNVAAWQQIVNGAARGV